MIMYSIAGLLVPGGGLGLRLATRTEPAVDEYLADLEVVAKRVVADGIQGRGTPIRYA